MPFPPAQLARLVRSIVIPKPTAIARRKFAFSTPSSSSFSSSASSSSTRNLPPRRRILAASMATTTTAATAAAIYVGSVAQTDTPSTAPESAAAKSHHVGVGKGFQNPWPSWREMAGPAVGATMAMRYMSGTWKAAQASAVPGAVPVRAPSFPPGRETPALRATWLGHACFLVEFPSGLRVLFDPVFEERCGPNTWLGPKRFTPPACAVEGLPNIDAVVISHNHYDHLSEPTVVGILKSQPRVQFFVPLGVKAWAIKCKVPAAQVTEMDWWEEKTLRLVREEKSAVAPPNGETAEAAAAAAAKGPNDITATIGCLPCQHTSARSPFDRAATLWASWSVTSGGKSVWFAGDTGYRAVPKLPQSVDDYGPGHDYPHCPAFKEIGKLRGPFDLGLIPIGAYDPRHIMSSMHANPFDSVEIFKDTACRRALGMHWGTWILTEEPVTEPPQLLKKALHRSGLAEEGVFDVCDIGESRTFA